MSADPAIYDGMTIYRGLTFTKVFICKDLTGALVDLTGKTAEFKAKATTTSVSSVIDLTTAPGIVLGAGTITITVSATDTQALTDNELVYSLKLFTDAEADGLLVGVIPVSDKAI